MDIGKSIIKIPQDNPTPGDSYFADFVERSLNVLKICECVGNKYNIEAFSPERKILNIACQK
ncbi:MAG: hypothetical protein QOD89_2544 [Bradyrhizobium sp.]|nr:hypothetical protein [Bradyrhizobium sp.]